MEKDGFGSLPPEAVIGKDQRKRQSFSLIQ
jgi:hypothetical protein